MPLVSRRDFLNGVLLASSAAALGPVAGAARAAGLCDGPIGRDPRVLRSGDLPATFEIGHWLRDRRLAFTRGAVDLAPGCDGRSGRFPIGDDGEAFDVVVVGSGFAGLATAFYLLRRRPETRILLLEANDRVGGNAARDDGAPLPVMASTCGAYCALPYADFLLDIYKDLDLDLEKYRIAHPQVSYYFDENTPGVRPGFRGWNVDTFGKGLAGVPYDDQVVRDLVRSRDAMLAVQDEDGAPTDPANASDPRFDDLSTISLRTYLTEKLKCDPIVADFYTSYTKNALGGTAQQVNAHSAVNFLASEYTGDLFAYPGGNSELAQRLSRRLTRPAQPGDRARPVDIRLNAIALRVDAGAPRQPGAGVTYFAGGRFRRASARAVVVATHSGVARHLIDHLADDDRRAAWEQFNTVPIVTANVAIRSAAPFVDAGLGYAQFWWGSRHWADFGVADWATPDRERRDRRTVLTFYGGNSAALEDLAGERMKMLQTPFADYERSLRDDLSRIMRGTAFDADRDIEAIFLYRWGHSLFMARPNFVFGSVRGADGRLDRGRSARAMAIRPLGPVSFAGQHTEGTPSVESAIASGRRAADEVLARL